MAKRLITIEDVLQLAEAGNSVIRESEESFIITPGAADKALELGITFGNSSNHRNATTDQALQNQIIEQVVSQIQSGYPTGIDDAKLQQIVREVVEKRQQRQGSEPGGRNADASDTGTGVCHIDSNHLLNKEKGSLQVKEKALIANAIVGDEKTKLSGGYMEWEQSSFERTVDYPEINIVISGELQLITAGKTLSGKPGDMFYFAPGTAVTYSTPSNVKLACVSSF